MSVEKYDLTIQKILYAWINWDSIFSYSRKNLKMFNITSKYFSIVNNKPPPRWVAHITRDFLTCYSCLYYNSMLATNVYLLMFLALILNISIVSFPSNLSELNVLGTCYKVIPIDIVQGLEFRLWKIKFTVVITTALQYH